MALTTQADIKTFVDGYTNTTTGDIRRKRFIIYGRKGNSGDWTKLGYKQESASVTPNYDTEEIVDINGEKYNDKTAKNETFEMSETRFNPNKTAFLMDAVKYVTASREDQLKDYQLLYVCEWLKSSTHYLARLVDGVTLTVDNVGGQSFTTGDITFKGISQGKIGYVDSIVSPSFTEGSV